jgi:dipeptidyl aminopeptidase/acylaminoacyl peptidase
MIDEHQVREILHRRANAVPTIVVDAPKAARRARRRLLANGVVVMLAAAAIAVATFAGVDAIRSAPVPADRPTPSPGVLRTNGEVLSFTGVPPFEAPGDLVAVNPETGEERVLVEDLDLVYSARWSADGRWVAYEDDAGLWVVGPGQESRPVTRGLWSWSPTGARLAILEGLKLSVLDVASESTTELGRLTDATSTPVWSPDGSRLVYGARGGTVASVDVESGERSIVVELPGEDLGPNGPQIKWSPDGTRLAILSDIEPGVARLYLVNADGSDVRVLLDDVDGGETAWSPGGARIAYLEFGGGGIRIFTQTLDGDAPILVGAPAVVNCAVGGCGYPVWSPDGSRIAFQGGPFQGGFEVIAVDADGQGEAERIDDLTYRSWDGGWYSCERLVAPRYGTVRNPCQ